MKLKFVCDLEKCSACAACAIACMDQNDINMDGEKPVRRHVYDYEVHQEDKVVYASMSCLHCADAPCVIGCPTGSLYKDAETGLTLYDKDKCVGCHSCALACPYGAPCFDSDGKIDKCDGCYGRRISGLEPACVRACPVGALECIWVPDDEPDDDYIAKIWPKSGKS